MQWSHLLTPAPDTVQASRTFSVMYHSRSFFKTSYCCHYPCIIVGVSWCSEWGQGELAGNIEASMLPRGDMDGLKWALGHSVTKGRHRWPEMSPWLFLRGGRCILWSPCTQDRGVEPYPTKGDPVCAEHSGSKGVDLEKQSPILWCECRAYGMNGSGLVCL
jgi:hypothetical protein